VRLQREGIDLSYDVVGEGLVPAVFVHGFQNSGATWRSTATALGTDITAVLPDLVGCGDSSRPASSERCSIEADAADIAALIDHLGLERPVLVGHSLGAGIVLRLALDQPDIARSIVVVAPISTRGLDFVSPEHVERLAYPSVDEQLALLRAAAYRPLPAERLAELEAIVRRATPEHIEGSARAMRDFVVEGELANLAVPTLLVAGDRDRHVPLRNHLATALAIPRCGVQIFHDVGHVPFLEVPDAFVDLVRRWIS
jgi:sigma-B regulation protein RsbQ